MTPKLIITCCIGMAVALSMASVSTSFAVGYTMGICVGSVGLLVGWREVLLGKYMLALGIGMAVALSIASMSMSVAIGVAIATWLIGAVYGVLWEEVV